MALCEEGNSSLVSKSKDSETSDRQQIGEVCDDEVEPTAQASYSLKAVSSLSRKSSKKIGTRNIRLLIFKVHCFFKMGQKVLTVCDFHPIIRTYKLIAACYFAYLFCYFSKISL